MSLPTSLSLFSMLSFRALNAFSFFSEAEWTNTGEESRTPRRREKCAVWRSFSERRMLVRVMRVTWSRMRGVIVDGIVVKK